MIFVDSQQQSKSSRSKEAIFDSAPELKVNREYLEEKGVTKETPGSRTSINSGQCKIVDEDDAKYVIPKMDITYSLREEEDKEDASNMMISSETIRKSNRTKNPPSVKRGDLLWSI